MPSDGFAPLVRVWRGNREESLHHGAVAAAGIEGDLILAAGDPARPVFLRSTAKPFQAWPLLHSGAARQYQLTPAHLAVACGSHGGEPVHLEVVKDLLARGGHTPASLQCGPHPPMHRATAEQLIREGREPSALHNNCSGKHAGMLLLARHLDADPAHYLDPAGAVQQAAAAAVASHCGVAPDRLETAVDGCSAPTFAVPLAGLAQGYARLAAALDGGDVDPHLGRIAAAMTGHPELVAGSGRLDTALMQAAEGRLVAKVGAEGLYAVAVARTPRGPLGLALKLADGDADRARTPLVLELLAHLGALPRTALAGLSRAFPREVRNHRGRVVGRVEVSLPLRGK